MTRLSSRDREKLYDAEVAKARELGLGKLPICRICGLPVDGTRQRWHENHNRHHPRWLGGDVDGISHKRCNLENAYRYATPLFHKNNRLRQRHIGAKVRKGRPMVGTIDSDVKLKIGGGRPIDRRTGQEF